MSAKVSKGGPQAVMSDGKGGIFVIPGAQPAYMEGGLFFPVSPDSLIPVPASSELFFLPDRRPVILEVNGELPAEFVGKELFPMACFLPPGHTVTHNPAYKELPGAKALPLFAYAAVFFMRGQYYASAVTVDRRKCHDMSLMPAESVASKIKVFRKLFRKNRLVRHLETCALTHGCPNARNFFLSRYEAPLPTSPSCNASCAGCISEQKGPMAGGQPRITFVPEPEEIAEIALYHINNVKNAVVSFGQGCEGEPLLSGRTIEKAIRIIRASTGKGRININTNASAPDTLSGLADAGLDSVRVSLNSAREAYYKKYYKPRYRFRDVVGSIDRMGRVGVTVSLNYLTMPGFTDSRVESMALLDFLSRHKVDMIQWRNLNFDPLAYFRLMRYRPVRGDVKGVRAAISDVKKKFPRIRHGYFNPAK